MEPARSIELAYIPTVHYHWIVNESTHKWVPIKRERQGRYLYDLKHDKNKLNETRPTRPIVLMKLFSKRKCCKKWFTNLSFYILSLIFWLEYISLVQLLQERQRKKERERETRNNIIAWITCDRESNRA